MLAGGNERLAACELHGAGPEKQLVQHRGEGGGGLFDSVYTSGAYRALVSRLGMRYSAGRTGVSWDNARPSGSSPP